MLQLRLREFDGHRVPEDRCVAPLATSHEAEPQGACCRGPLYVLCFGIAGVIVGEALALLYTLPS